MAIEPNTFDVIVVQHGVAGMCAAQTANQEEARVCVLERSPREERRGNTRWTDSARTKKNY